MNTYLRGELNGCTAREESTMETEEEKQRPAHGQLISVPHKDTIRLLEVYVKRSLSLNESALRERRPERKEKWVTIPKRQRRSSSDPSLILADDLHPRKSNEISEDEVEAPTNQPERHPDESEKPTKKSKKSKKPSFWKNVLGFFSRKNNEDKDEEQESPPEASGTPDTPASSQNKPLRRKSLKRRLSKRKLSIRLSKSGKDLNSTKLPGVEAVISVEPTYSYYEKVSEELEKIVHEVKVKEEVETLSNEDLINRIIALTKEHGDAIDYKLKDNPTLNKFFQQMSYSSFQKLADAYLEKEATPAQSPPTVLPTAPELVKLAFTLDFTARIASLSKHNVCHITGLGNRYLQDRFEYKQACTDHPWSDTDD
ncbi:transcriptional regulator ATRX homolog [Cololabis saira]|uniref:transcriptional regulator ATRX homolog n=1 Tax=Cololabis saira TaxID=129043 RepID=UPI002AD58E12|nr:transcriptional regulator ATRX homolog [Cololabis saira]